MRPTEIGYADYSCNPIRARRVDAPRTPEEAERFEGRVSPGWACVRVSPGCTNCYAATLNRRLGTGLDYTVPNLARAETYLDERVIQDMLRFRPKPPYKNGRSRPVVFVCDMTDLFGEWVTDAMRDRVFVAAALRPDVEWLLLTKRPERALAYLTAPYVCDRVLDPYRLVDIKVEARHVGIGWPLPNVGIGVSVENQAALEQRVGVLASIPAAWRWLSCEPLLGPLDLGATYPGTVHPVVDIAASIDWLVVGGESGPWRRPCEMEWIADIVRQCDAADVPVFVKQDSGPRPGEQGRIPAELWARKEVWP